MPSSAHPLAVLAVAALAAALGCGLIIRAILPLLERYALARPNARSSHVKPTAQGGGIAVVLATLAVTWALIGSGLAAADRTTGSVTMLAAASLVIIAVAILGAVDDIRPLPVTPRLALQCLAAVALVWLVPPALRPLAPLPALIETLVLVPGLVWFINLTNFMDGLDEITVAEMLPVTVTLALLGLVDALPWPMAVLAAALAGALVGFWPWNRHVARLFLGDVGSLAIGALVGWLLILLAGRGHLAAALILPLYYLADATLTLFARWRRGERLSQAHRSHFYQRAVSLGRSVPGITRAVLATNVALAALAVITVFARSLAVDIAALAVAALATGGLLRFLAPYPAMRSA